VVGITDGAKEPHMEPERIGRIQIPTLGEPLSAPKNTTKISFYEARMLRRGFDPAHVATFNTPPHPDYDAVFARVLETCARGTGSIFALSGRRGTGKTQLATNVAGRLLNPRDEENVLRRAGLGDTWRGEVAYKRAVVDDEATWPLYSTARDFFRELKESWNPPADGKIHHTETQVIDKYVDPCLLVLDEASVRSESKWEDDQLTELIDRRCYRGRSTLLLSNLSREAFAKALGPSIVSRIHEFGDCVECNWPSFREKQA
jgi:DNA replication protein DnaC